MRIRSLAIAGSVALAASFAVAGPASAAQPPDTNCWGMNSAQAAQYLGGLGEHASSQDSPRMGIGNTARALGLAGPGELGAFLASVDGIDATTCGG